MKTVFKDRMGKNLSIGETVGKILNRFYSMLAYDTLNPLLFEYNISGNLLRKYSFKTKCSCHYPLHPVLLALIAPTFLPGGAFFFGVFGLPTCLPRPEPNG